MKSYDSSKNTALKEFFSTIYIRNVNFSLNAPPPAPTTGDNHDHHVNDPNITDGEW